jgi:CMP-N,N'-diacetyllegionaminic acid synthase
MSGTIAVIHARGGSKRIPLKNLRVVGGKPLIAYPIDLCKQCKWIDRIIVTSDHDAIMEAARAYGAEVPFRRPADISEDVPSELVTLHALEFIKAQDGALPEYAVTLTPATPLTAPTRLNEAFELLQRNINWDSVTTIRRATEHPEWILKRDSETGEVATLLGNSLDGEFNVSQNLKPYFYPSGAFWINRVANFMEQRSMYGLRWGAIVMEPNESVDIDWPADLAEADKRLRIASP